LTWQIEWDEKARRELRKLDKPVQKAILKYLRERIAEGGEDPRSFGKALGFDKFGLWRYRVGDYRIVCRIEDDKLIVVVVKVGHRRQVYE